MLHFSTTDAEKGQGVIEFIFFLPILLVLYGTVVTLGNAINASINQQKVTRGYFYARVKNNSTIPKPLDRDLPDVSKLGMFFIGWKESFVNGQVPRATCFKVSLPLKDARESNCQEPYTDEVTRFIRIYTVYGMCGQTYRKVNDRVLPLPFVGESLSEISNVESCLMID